MRSAPCRRAAEAVRVGLDARLVGPGLGVSQVIVNIARHLSEDVEIVWLGDPALAPCEPYAVVRADRWPYPVLDGPGGRLWGRRAGVDLIHFAANTGWRRPSEVPFVLTVHDLLYIDTGIRDRSLRQIVGHRYARWNVIGALRSADAVASPSHTVAEEVARRTGRKPVVIPNGVDTELLEMGDARSGVARNQPDRRYAVAFAARDPRKGIDLAIKGWRAAGGVPSRLVLLAGGGIPAGIAAEIESDREQGLIEVKPYMSRHDLVDLLAGADVLIYPSESEGFGLPVVEAMAVGVPVITGLNPAVREVAAGACVMIDPNEPVTSIAGSLLTLDRDPLLRAQKVEIGRRRARDFSWRTAARAYEKLYGETLQSRRRCPTGRVV
jgi:glycosyltransferase involved in cell wall biosynthesis